jgi:hypothetical protein
MNTQDFCGQEGLPLFPKKRRATNSETITAPAVVQVERIPRLDRFAEQNLFPVTYFAPIVITNAALERQFLQGELSKISFFRFGKRDDIPACPHKRKLAGPEVCATAWGKPELVYLVPQRNPSILAVE